MGKIGLLFGSFNPPHNGHIMVAQGVLDRGIANEVWFVVSPQNPFKEAADLAPFDDRIEMVRLAIAGRAKMAVCEVERHLPRPSYTINTIEKLLAAHPSDTFIILAGSDIAAQVSTWHRAEDLRNMVNFLYYPRGGGESSPALSDMEQTEANSTAIREGAGNAGGMVAPAVADYITSRGLYLLTAEGYYGRGLTKYAAGDFGGAVNDLVRAQEMGHPEASQQLEMVESVLAYRYTDYYNP